MRVTEPLLEIKCDDFSSLFEAESQIEMLAGNSLNSFLDLR